jgi:hypothetical protein
LKKKIKKNKKIINKKKKEMDSSSSLKRKATENNNHEIPRKKNKNATAAAAEGEEDEEAIVIEEGDSNTNVTIEIQDVHHFQQTMGALAKQKSNITFSIIYSPSFVGLEIATMTDGMVCMIEGRFACSIFIQNDYAPTSKKFSVSIKTLQSTLLSSFFIIWRIEDTSIRCEMITQNDHRKVNGKPVSGAEIRVPLLQTEEEQTLSLNNPEFAFAIPFGQGPLRAHLNLLSTLEIGDITFTLYRDPNNHAGLYFVLFGENTSSQNALFFYYGKIMDGHEPPDAACEHLMNIQQQEHRIPISAKHWLDITSQNIIPPQPLQSAASACASSSASGSSVSASSASASSTSPNWNLFEKIYEESFSIKILDPYLKNSYMEHTNMILYLSNHMPLVIHFQVKNASSAGAATAASSYLRYYVAPLQKNNE